VKRTDIDGDSSRTTDHAPEAPLELKRRRRTDPEAARSERRELVRELERGLQRAQRSHKYRSFLQTLSRFYSFSISNTVLIWRERPNATRVSGYRAWLALGRQVRWGAKGIRIMAPTYRRAPPAIGPELGDSESREIGRLRFRIVSVFDVSQTDAIDDTPPSSPVVHLPHDPGLTPAEAAKFCYQVALNCAAHIDCRMERETISESGACIVLGRYGIQTPDYSFSYLTRWPDLSTFRARLLDIQAIAIRLIESNEDETHSLASQPDHLGDAPTNAEEARDGD
jgi:N-terminal domain of anti-restriction factor ArdC